MIFIVGGRRQQTSNVLIEIIVNSNLRKEENYIFIQKESIYDNVLWVVGLFMKFYFLLKTRAFVSYEKHELWSFCGHIWTGGTVKRQVACLSRVVLIEMVGDKSSTIQEFFSFYFHSFQRKNGGACCSSSWNAALSIYYWSLSESSQPFVCRYKQFSKGGRQNSIRIFYQI